MNTHRQNGDTLFTWDYLPQFYFATGLKSKIRLLSAHYLNDSPYARRRFGNELFDTLKRDSPTFIVTRWHPDPEKLAAKNPFYREFRNLVKNRYVPIYSETSAGGIQVFIIGSRDGTVRSDL